MPGGVELHFPAFRHPGPKLAAVAFGLVFLWVGLLTGGTGMPLVMRVGFGALGAAIAVASLYQLLVSLRVRIDKSGLEVRRRRLGLPAGGARVPRHNLRSLMLKQSYSSSSGSKHTVYFKLQALTGDGKSVTIGHNLAGRDAAIETRPARDEARRAPGGQPAGR